MVNPLPWALGDRATGLAGWRPGQPVAKAPLHSTGAASCLPALLLGRILPVCSLVAPTARRITGLGATRGSATDCHRQGEECQRVKRPAGSRRAAADVLPGANDPDAARFLVPCPQAAAEDRPCRKVVFPPCRSGVQPASPVARSGCCPLTPRPPLTLTPTLSQGERGKPERLLRKLSADFVSPQVTAGAASRLGARANRREINATTARTAAMKNALR